MKCVFCSVFNQSYRQLRARRALSIFKDVPMRTRRELCCTMSMLIVPFWFSMKHLWIEIIAPFWLSTDDTTWFLHVHQYVTERCFSSSLLEALYSDTLYCVKLQCDETQKLYCISSCFGFFSTCTVHWASKETSLLQSDACQNPPHKNLLYLDADEIWYSLLRASRKKRFACVKKVICQNHRNGSLSKLHTGSLFETFIAIQFQ